MRIHLSAALAALALAGCGDPSGSGDSQQGLLRFDYSGAATGSYRAEAPSPDTTGNASYALGRAVPFGVEILSRADAGAPPVLRMQLVANGTAPGRYPVAVLCDMLSAARCAAGRVQFPADPATGPGASFFLVAGELRITSSSRARVRGTFSGTARRTVASEIQVLNGEFDVPVLSP